MPSFADDLDRRTAAAVLEPSTRVLQMPAAHSNIAHPTGMRSVPEVNALNQRGGRYGLQTVREGGGMANATIIERL